MKALAFLLVAGTAAVIALLAPPRSTEAGDSAARPVARSSAALHRPQVEVVFALDTTGSMSGLIETAKEKIWSIASTLGSAQPAPRIRMGLVAYRDRGDRYVTAITDLSTDLDAVHARLLELRAEGGGDGPESVNQALHDAVHRVSWSRDPRTYRVIFLIGDAPPHMDYADDVGYPRSLRAASERGIVVNAVQCGSSGSTREAWQRIAALGQGRYLQVEQAGGGVAVATPFDERLAALAAELDETRLFYGKQSERSKHQAKQAATARLHALASPASLARRAEFNASPSGAENLAGKGDLVHDLESGRVGLEAISPEELPPGLRGLSPAQAQAAVDATAERRRQLRGRIGALARRRADYVSRELESTGAASGSLDVKLYDTVREQAAEQGLRYEAPAPRY